jgi:tetratricopeptide (TPR) repeat protein
VDELKNRAKACIGARNYPETLKLYTRAIELTTSDAPNQSILHGNRSMIHLNMNQPTLALEDAETSIRLDASYVKAYYRKAMAAMALNQYVLAQSALTTGLTLKPDDKELNAQLQKVNEKLSNNNSNTVTSNNSNNNNNNNSVPAATRKVNVTHNTETNNTNKSSTSSTTSATSKSSDSNNNNNNNNSSNTNNNNNNNNKMEVDDDDDEAELAKLNLRGYKKTADGRVTTFFNRDLDEQTKALIGNIAPKKLDDVSTTINHTPTLLSTAPTTTTGSAWNAAGTYEETNLTSFVNQILPTYFSSSSREISTHPGYGRIIVEILKIDNLQGHAQVTINRGKKKHVCDYSFTLYWKLLAYQSNNNNNGGEEDEIEGNIQVFDITADGEYEIDQCIVTKYNEQTSSPIALTSLSKSLQELITKVIKLSKSPLHMMIEEGLQGFWRELKTK